jgi:hypothetical protein
MIHSPSPRFLAEQIPEVDRFLARFRWKNVSLRERNFADGRESLFVSPYARYVVGFPRILSIFLSSLPVSERHPWQSSPQILFRAGGFGSSPETLHPHTERSFSICHSSVVINNS